MLEEERHGRAAGWGACETAPTEASSLLDFRGTCVGQIEEAFVGTTESGAFGVPQPEPDVEVATVGGPGPDVDVTDDASPLESDQPSDLSSETTAFGGGGPTGGSEAEEVGSTDSDNMSQDAVAAALQGLETQIQGFHARAENYERIVRQMQNRIEQLQGDQVQALLKPVIQRFAGLHAQAVEASEKARERGESAEKDFGFFTVAIEEALGLVDIESVGAAPDVEFDSRKHHASRIVPTADPTLDQRVQRVLRQGFTYVGAPRVFLPAQVSVYRFEPAQPIAEAEAPESSPTSEPGEGDPGE